MYWATDPSLVTRVAFLAATETPFLRRITTACSISPLASVRACLQSIIGAPVFSRRSFTCAAEMFAIVVLIAKNVPSLIYQPALQTLTRAGNFLSMTRAGLKSNARFLLATGH